MNSILFNIACLDEGLPPMDNKISHIRTMILELPSDKRRAVSRKIKKICKRSIKERVKNIPMSRRKKVQKELEGLLAFNHDNTLLINDVLVGRILCTRRFLMEKELRKRKKAKVLKTQHVGW